jgi:peptidylprolyl isomerase
MRFCILSTIIIAAVILSSGCTQQSDKTEKTELNTGALTSISTGITAIQEPSTTVPVFTESWKRARFETNMGNITIALDPAMPVTAGNFETLVAKGYYNGVIFHRVINGFMIQGGDPSGTGRGGPGYLIEDEFTANNRNDRGTIAMANTGLPNTGGSQFFINLVNNNYLDSKHPVFGKVVEGMDVVDTIAKVQTNGQAGGNRPLENVTIIRAIMI